MIKKLSALAIAMSLMFGTCGVAEAKNYIKLYGSNDRTEIAGVEFKSETTGATNENTAGTSPTGTTITTGADFEVKSGQWNYVWGGYSLVTGAKVTNNKVTISGGEVKGDINGGYSDSGAVTNNTLNISGGTVNGTSTTAGGSYSGAVTNNTVNISGGILSSEINGGSSYNGEAKNNTVNISGGEYGSGNFSIIAGSSYNGEAKNNTINISGGNLGKNMTIRGGHTDSGAVTNNTVIMTGGTIYAIYVGSSTGNGEVKNNTVYLSDGTVTDTIGGGFSFDSGAVTNNTVNISGGTMRIVCGGLASDSGAVTNNTVNISGGEVKSWISGGSSYSGNVTSNTVNISGGIVRGTVFGGRSSSGAVTNNSVNISGTAILTSAILNGYDGENDLSSHSNNTLTVASNWTGTVKSIQYFDSIVNDGDLTVTEGVSATKTTGSTALPADLTFTNNNSFGGNLIKDSSSTLNFINNGTWYPIFTDNASTNSATAITLAENGIISLNYGSDSLTERASRKLEITGTSFTSNGGTFVINTNLARDTGDVIDLSGLTTVTGSARVQVAYDPCFKTGTTVTGNHKFLLLPSTSTESSLILTGLATDYNGVLYTPTLAYDGATSDSNGWKITSVKSEPNNSAKAAGDTANVQNFVWLETVNNLQKRLGDLRGGEASDIPWARFQRNNDDYDGARPFNVSGNMYQVGYDFALHNQIASRGYFGVSLEAFDGTQSYQIGGGDVKSMSLGAYYTKIYDSGHYFDFILRYGRQESDSTSYDSSLLTPTLTKLDYAMNSFTLSGEYGYRANLGKSGFYLEPQAEFIYGYLSGAKATSSTGLLADIDSTNHFVGRLGLAFGQRVKNFNYYLRGSYYHDFAGTTNVKYGDASYKQDSAQNWWEVSLGGGWNISKVSYFYAELIKHFKDVSNSLNFNVGFRFTL